MPTITKILFITDKAPYASISAKESLDAALVGAAFGQEISLLFRGDAVYQLIKNQSPDVLPQKNIGAALTALELYDIQQVFVCRQSMLTRGLKANDFVIETQPFDPEQLADLMEAQDHILTF